MLIWNVKDSCLQGYKTKEKYFSFGDEVPEDEINPGRKERLLEIGWLKEKKSKAPAIKKEAPKPAAITSRPLPLPKKESKPKKKGRK